MSLKGWIKSSHSYSNGNCVELVGLPDGGVAVRDSKDIRSGVLRFTRDEWDAFLKGAKAGQFDHLIAGAPTSSESL